LAAGVALALGATAFAPAMAQDGADEAIEEIITTGIRGSLYSSVAAKRDSEGILDGIVAEDIGKLPDVTIADSLQRIPGIQIQRSAGEGATVNIRGLPQIRTLLNGEEFITTGNIGRAQPNLVDIPSQLIRAVDVYKSTQLRNKRSGLTGTIDLKTWRPLDFDEGFTSQVAADYSQGDFTSEDDLNLNGLINWSNGEVGVMVSALTSEVNLGNNFAGMGGGVFPANDWGGYGAGADEWVAPHGFESFNRAIERNRDAINAAFQARIGENLKFTAEAFHTEMEEYDRKVGLNISNRWTTLNWLTPTDSTNLGITRNNWSGGEWVSSRAYDVDALWVNSFTVNRALNSEADHYNLELQYDADNFMVRARYINDSADFLSMNGQSQGDLSNWQGTQLFQVPNPANGGAFYPANICAQYDPSRVNVVGDLGGCFIDANPQGYGEDPQLAVDFRGGITAWSGFDTPIAGGLGAGATLADYMANVGSYAIGAFSSEGNQENTADNNIFSLDGAYFFEEPVGGFLTEVRMGGRLSTREHDITNFHLFSDFYAGQGSGEQAGCAAQWKAIDVVMNNDQCLSGETIAGEFQGYTVNRPTGLDEYNNVVFVNNYGGVTTGLPGVWAADPRDYDNVTAFHQRVFGGANRVIRPGQSYSVELEELSFFVDTSFEWDNGLSGTLGFRYIDTTIKTRQNLVGDIQAYGDTNLDIGDEFSESSYDDVLPALNLAYRPNDNWTFRFSYSKNMMAHDLGTYGGGLTIFTVACPVELNVVGGRCVSGAAEGGNPELDPWRTDNFDVSVEYYLGDATMFNVGLFRVDIESFTSGGTRRDSFPDSDGVIRREVDVSTVILGEGGEIEGVELGARMAFSDFTSGPLAYFGMDANYTYAPSDANSTNPAGSANPFPDNSEHQYNLVGWFQNDQWQARIAYNYRSERYTGDQGGIPGYQDAIGYLDAQVTYAVSENISVYLNGSNITGEIEDYYLDWGVGPTQYWQQNEFEARYTLGVRAKF